MTKLGLRLHRYSSLRSLRNPHVFLRIPFDTLSVLMRGRMHDLGMPCVDLWPVCVVAAVGTRMAMYACFSVILHVCVCDDVCACVCVCECVCVCV